MSKRLLLGLALTVVAACGDDGVRHTCGAGTTVAEGECVAIDAGDTNMTSCGSGTHLEGTTCVADPAGGGAAPTLDTITPTHAGISGLTADGGGVFFEITGSGFMDPKAGDITVTFGTVKTAAIVMDDTTIDGIIPGNTAITAPVTVSDANGSAMLAFTYDALIAADGQGQAGDAYIIDPTNGFDLDLGPMMEDDGTGSAAAMGVSALDFDGDTLYAATIGASGGTGDVVAGVDIPRQLVKVDLQTGVTTIIGPLVDANQTAQVVTDMKFNGGTLYAAIANPDAEGGAFATIDPATGIVTTLAVAPGAAGRALGFDGSGALWFAGNSDGGPLTSVDPGTGSGSAGPTLDGNGQNVDAMALEGGTLYGSVIFESETSNGSELASIDTSTGTVVYVGPIPSLIDAIATPPATLAIARMATLPWHHTVKVAGPAPSRASCASLAPTTRLPHGRITVTACGGQHVTVSAASVKLVRNRRGQTKLVDGKTHRTLLRNVTSLQ